MFSVGIGCMSSEEVSMETKSVFDPTIFTNPPNCYRPLQIVHGLDQYSDASAVGQPAPDEKTRSGGPDAYLEKLARLGIGGIVTNVGFQDYLVSPQQWDILRHGLQKASDLSLRLWLYDEKGYPSGTAGGIVTRANPEYTALGLACYITQVSGPADVEVRLPVSCRKLIWVGAMRNPNKATRDSVTDLSDQADEWGTVRWSAPEGAWTVLYLAERVMYEGTHAAGNVCEFKHYLNLINPAATKAFLRVTHEAYRRELPQVLWDKIEAIFTDEPSFMTYYVAPLPERFQGKIPVIDALVFTDRPPTVPWASDLLEQFHALKGYDLCPYLFDLFFSEAEEACWVRQDYYDVITRLYADAFYGQVQRWCRKHGIASSGHVLLEETIADHLAFHGSLFAVIRRMDLPGIDMLNSDPQDMLHGGSFMGESFMAIKQVASVAHLTGCERVHSESSDWEQHNQGRFASLAERQGQANLQYVLGVNQITSYFGWDELGEAAQRAYNVYVGRLGALLTGGKHVCDAAVLYPIRTLWAHYLPLLEPIQSWVNRPNRDPWTAKLQKDYPILVKQLLCNQIDLDIIDEEAILTAELRNGALHVSNEAYRAIVLPPLDALALETIQTLASFCRAGGVLFSVGDLPTLAETRANTEPLRREVTALFASGLALNIELGKLPTELRRHIPPDFNLDQPNPDILYTHRLLEDRHLYFVINNATTSITIQATLRQPGPYTLYRPLTGQVIAVAGPLLVALAGYEAVFVVCG